MQAVVDEIVFGNVDPTKVLDLLLSWNGEGILDLQDVGVS